MRTKRSLITLLAALLCFSLCLVLLPKGAAAAVDGDVFIGPVQVAGVNGFGNHLTDEQYLKADLSPGTASNYAIMYDPYAIPATITVKDNVTVPAAYHGGYTDTSSCIYAEGVDLEINIEAGKTLTLSNSSTATNPSGQATSYDYGIHLSGSSKALTVSGGGRLTVTVTGGNNKLGSYGIYAGSLTVMTGTTVDATAGSVRDTSCGVGTVGQIYVVLNASLTAKGGTGGFSSGVSCAELRVNGALNATGDAAKDVSYGVYTHSGDIYIEDGQISGTGGTAEKSSYGVWTNSRVTMYRGSLTGIGGIVSDSGDAEGYSCGVYANTCFVLKGTLIGTGSDVTRGARSPYGAHSYGVQATHITANVIAAGDTNVVTGTGGNATAAASSAESCGILANFSGAAASITGRGGRSEAATGSENASYGVKCSDDLEIGTDDYSDSLTGIGGEAVRSGGVYGSGCVSVGVQVGGALTVGTKGTLTGTGGSGGSSIGVRASQSVTINGSMTASGAAVPSQSSNDQTSVGISCTGTIALSGTLTASAGEAFGTSYGVQADGIALSGSGRLTASTATLLADVNHAAKRVKTGDGLAALTAESSAVWREGTTGVFTPLSFDYDDRDVYLRLEVVNDGGIAAGAVPAAPGSGATVTLVPTPAATGRYSSYTWYSNTSNAYDAALPSLAGDTVTAGADTQYCYCVGTTATGEKVRSNIISVTAARFGISLDKSGTQRMVQNLTQGYADAKRGTMTVQVTNTGNQPTGALQILLEGADATSFVLSANLLPSIPVGGKASFTVRPETELLANGTSSRTYEARITVVPAAGNTNAVEAQFFNVQQLVSPAPTVSIVGNSSIITGSSATLTATPAFGSWPYTYAWSTGETTVSITVSPTATTDYTVSLIDYCGVSATSAPFTVSVADPSYGLALDPAGPVDFGVQEAGYAQPAHQQIFVKNTGNMECLFKDLSIAYSKDGSAITPAAGAEPFTVASYLFPTSPLVPYDPAFPYLRTFTVQPKANLTVGVYEADITVSSTGTDPADTAVKASQTLHVKFTVGTAPTLSGDMAKTLIAGYAACSTDAYTVTGVPASLVTQDTTHGGKIVWNPTTKKLDIATGLAAGSYSVVLTATNGVMPDAQHTFTLTVTAQSYTLGIDPAAKDFGTRSAGYSALFRPLAQTVTITNNGNVPVTPEAIPANTGYDIEVPSDWATPLAPNATRRFTVRPKTDLPAATYNTPVTVTTAEGSSAVFTPTFVVNGAMTVTIDPPSANIIAGQQVTLTATVTGGTGSYSYAWSGGGISETTQAVTVSPTTTTTYTVLVTDQGDTNKTALAEVTVTAQSYTLGIDPAVKDFGTRSAGYSALFRPLAQTVTITNNGNVPVTPEAIPANTGYDIEVPSDWATPLAPNATRRFTVRPKTDLPAATYNTPVTVTTAEGSRAVFTPTFVVNGAMSVSIDPPSANIIAGQQVTLTATVTGGTGSYSYAWSGGGISETTQAVTVSPTATTTYTVLVTDQGDTNKTALAEVTVTAQSYDIALNPASLSFAAVTAGYAAAPDAQTVTVTNNGNWTVTLQAPSSTRYDFGAFGQATLAAGASTTFTVRPKLGLAAGDQSETITVSTDKGTSAPLSVSFTVNRPGALDIALGPRTEFAAGNSGGDYELVIGAGIDRSKLGAANLGSLTLTNRGGYVTSLRAGTDFTVRDGSIIVTLKERYLNSLTEGRYILTAHITGGIYDGQTPATTLTVKAAPVIPNTGDSAPLALLTALVLLSGCGLCLRARRRRRG